MSKINQLQLQTDSYTLYLIIWLCLFVCIVLQQYQKNKVCTYSPTILFPLTLNIFSQSGNTPLSFSSILWYSTSLSKSSFSKVMVTDGWVNEQIKCERNNAVKIKYKKQTRSSRNIILLSFSISYFGIFSHLINIPWYYYFTQIKFIFSTPFQYKSVCFADRQFTYESLLQWSISFIVFSCWETIL